MYTNIHMTIPIIMLELLSLLPYELQDIILRFSGIKYPKTEDQVLYTLLEPRIYYNDWARQIL